MTDLPQKLSHKEWRKAAKKTRRKRIRQHLAETRKAREKLRESSPTYLLEVEKIRLYEAHELEREAKEREEQEKKWLEEEERAQRQWREEQRLKELALEEKLKEQERIKKEWEKEQKKIKEQKEKIEALRKEEEKRKEEILQRINDFICNGGEIPIELQIVTETNPGKEMCSFYQKVGACRFGNQSKSSEYDTDISLEYEDSDMYLHFKDFYNDIVQEFKKFGEVTMVKVCCNTEFHLRGNVYVEYKNEREALIAYKTFQGRWYGGKQLNIEFVKIKDWGSAVCGDFVRRRCPKGKSCNFLHVFRNPRNEFFIDWNKNKNTSSSRDSFDDNHERQKRNWRWSETPEPSPRERHVNGRKRSRSPERRKRSRSPKKRRSRSSEKRRRSRSPRKKSKSRNSEEEKSSKSNDKKN